MNSSSFFSGKAVFLFLLSTGLSFNSFAQLSIGIKGGINNTTIRNKEGIAPWKTSNYVGVFSTLPLNKKLFLDAELYYSRRESKFNVDNFVSHFRMDYISAPLLAGYNLSKKLSMLLGPEFGFLVRVRSDDFSPDISSFARFDLGLAGGLSYKASNRLSADIRYVYGLTPLIASEGVDYSNGTPSYYPISGFARLRNRAFQVGLSYRISG